MNARLVLVCVLATTALLAGCQTTIPGTPVTRSAEPTEPSFPTSQPTRPTAAPPRTVVPTPTSTPPMIAPPGGEELPADGGFVFIETKSGKTRCQISRQEVGCESAFTNAPVQNGMPANGVRLTADGSVQWIVGNLGDIPAVTLDYKTYRALGWTIEAGEDGTRFTNDGTGHGMVVAVEGVETF